MADRLSKPSSGEEDFPEPPRLRALRRATTALMLVMALGMAAVAAALVMGLSGLDKPSAPIAAEALTLPDGAEVVSVGAESDRVLIVVRLRGGAERLLAFAKSDGALLSDTEIRRAP